MVGEMATATYAWLPEPPPSLDDAAAILSVCDAVVRDLNAQLQTQQAKHSRAQLEFGPPRSQFTLSISFLQSSICTNWNNGVWHGML